MRKFNEQKIVLASHNKGKLREIKALLEPFGIVCVSAAELNLAEPEETEATFSGNARIKAHFAA
jgi:XTP/dITP diphosphohydrolase